MRSDLDLFRSHGIKPEKAIYPGHPVTLAFCIVYAFPTYEAAFAKTGHNWAAAMGDSRCPGSGGCVASALDLLRSLKQKTATFDEAMAEADRVWSVCDDQQTRNPLRWKEGQDQANQIKTLLKRKRPWWLGP